MYLLICNIESVITLHITYTENIYLSEILQSDHHYVHRDIKPANILLNDQFEPIICDFGLLYDLELSIDQKGTKFTGTPCYTPIEAIEANIISTKWDVFSFGVIMLELLSGLSIKGKSKKYELSSSHKCYIYSLM